MEVLRREHEVLRLLEELVRFPSLSHEEGPVADYIEQYMRSRGLIVRRHHDNVWALVGEGDHRLLLNSHLDVVPPSADHAFAPFEPTLSEGYLYGRGTVDAKSSVAAMVAAALALHDEGWSPAGQLVVALTTCEEMGGSYNGLEDLLREMPRPDAAVVGEPTDLRPCTAQKGLLILNLRSTGRAAHAARASLGENAIVTAAADVLRLEGLRLDRVDELLGPVTVTPTIIGGGTAKNTVPDQCTVTLDIRSTPAYTHEELVAMIRETVESQVEIHSDRLVPVATPADEHIVRAAVAATGKSPFGSPTMSDWIFLSGTPAVKIGPGSSELSHTSHERIHPDEAIRAVDVYREIITRYFERDSNTGAD